MLKKLKKYYKVNQLIMIWCKLLNREYFQLKWIKLKEKNYQHYRLQKIEKFTINGIKKIIINVLNLNIKLKIKNINKNKSLYKLKKQRQTFKKNTLQNKIVVKKIGDML